MRPSASLVLSKKDDMEHEITIDIFYRYQR